MFGFVRPAACRSSAPRSVTDGCPYPPLPCRAKNRNKIQLSSHRKQEINENGLEFFHRCKNSFHRPRGGPPPSRREVWGFRRSRPSALPSIGYRGFAVAPITLRAPSRNVVVITIQISGCGKYKKRARNARPYGVRRCNRRLQMHLTVAIPLPQDLPLRGRGTVRRRWKE